ncbi:hypothetical protein TanjilG_09310 [Lupinus angustifolius]|uniref:RING-type domain-containing protein n=2 Tax=Lupinus angustifolius TaxID=3871 RepID=A0A4P1RM49_LUPAN|nr:PREDICTED: putative E3 ubiquitin-protein ligase RF298 isoform X2 [Lupinus angustifolius]XP_019439750.1 PREDICTED: putative E3 ubiquitin-protein ligase RF298 isoform X2 [Lupinus angustifolius]OIW13959.1 hypothetical protein TanjilG_09310 [Lupinus angustifolius]
MASKGTSGGRKGRRNKKKLRVDPSSLEPNKIVPSPQHESTEYEFSSVKHEMSPGQVQAAASKLLNVSQGNSSRSELDFALTNAVDALELRLNRRTEGNGADGCPDFKRKELTEARLEELILADLHIRFTRLIKKIAALSSCTEEAATKAMLRFSNCSGGSDTFSNIFDNTLAFLRNGQEIDLSKEHCFEDLVHLEKYVIAEMVCILQEVRPPLSVRDALWRLLVFDLNLLQACEVDTEPLSCLRCHHRTSDGCSSVQTESQSKLEAQGHELKLPIPFKSVPSGNPGAQNLKNSQVLGGLSEKEGDSVDKSLSTAATSQSHRMVELCGCFRKFHSNCTNRDYTLRQKFIVEKTRPANGPRGPSKTGKVASLNALILNKNVKSVMETTTINSKSASSSNISNTVGLDRSEDRSSTSPIRCNNEDPNSDCLRIPDNKSLTEWIPQENKDELILKLVPKVQELQDEIKKWTEWGNEKVMHAANELSKDKDLLTTLKKERDENEQLLKERQYLEESSLRRISEMESALDNARDKVGLANATVRKLEAQKAAFKKEMEAANLRAAESAKSFQEGLKREKDTQLKIQSEDKEKSLFQEILVTEKHKFAQLQQELKQAKEKKEQAEVRWRQARKATEEVLQRASSIRKERERNEEATKYKEEQMKLKAEKSLQSYEADIKKYEEEIAELRRKENNSKIAAIRSEIGDEEAWNTFVAELVTDMNDFSLSGRVKRERECVMCLYKEISVVFLPCAHQVVCEECNELLVNQGMQDCPSCRTPIQKRMSVRHAVRGQSYVFG